MTKSHPDSLAVFSLDDQQLALAVARLETVVQAVEISPLPGAPRGVRGVINVQGKVVPVFDLRVRFGRAEREVRVADHFVIVNTERRKVALIVDAAVGVVRADEAQVVAAAEILPEFDAIEGVMKLDGDIVFIHDLDRFLSLEDERELAAALSG
jgi:purine-binding chemotaxis protein CheW